MGYLSPPPSPQPVVVYKDVGGLVTDYEAQTEAYRRENREVRLHECRSACTLALSLPNVCVYPDAQVKFHQAYNALTHEVDLGVSAKLFGSYPPAVQGRLGYLTRQYRVLSGTELIALGVRNCQQDDRLMIAAKKPSPPRPQQAQPLQDFAQNVRVAVANALERPSDAPSAPISLPDRSSVPPRLARLAAAAQSSDAPLPPRRPAFQLAAAEPPARFVVLPNSVEASPEPVGPQLIAGAQPIRDASRFAPSTPSLQIVARRSPARAGG